MYYAMKMHRRERKERKRENIFGSVLLQSTFSCGSDVNFFGVLGIAYRPVAKMLIPSRRILVASKERDRALEGDRFKAIKVTHR